MPIPGELEFLIATIPTRQGGGAIAQANPFLALGRIHLREKPSRGFNQRALSQRDTNSRAREGGVLL